MGIISCKCCGRKRFVNRVESIPEKQMKILLLGLTGSGKTEVGFFLNQNTRNDFNPTIGVKTYQLKVPEGHVDLTEIGGNQEMQKIWHYYYATTMGIIFCFDMTKDYEELKMDFALLRKVMANTEVHGKHLLLVGVKSDIVDEGVQLYDIENVFQLERTALGFQSNLRVCHFAKTKDNLDDANGLMQGFNWLVKLIAENYEDIQKRIKYDVQQRSWKQKTEKLLSHGRLRRQKYRRFPSNEQGKRVVNGSWIISQLRRPQTAPPVIYTISSENESADILASNTQPEQ